MIGLPSGNILQYIYLKERIDSIKTNGLKSFIEVGNRNVKYKTTFPKVFNIILNPVILYPFHLLQKVFKNNKNNLVIYSELTINNL